MTEYRLTQEASCAGCAAKLNQKALASILSDLSFYRSSDTVVGIENYDDAGVFRLKDGTLLVQTVDFFPPIVDDPFSFGRIAAANALSDIYAMGGTPLTALNICCFPSKKYPPEVFSLILRGGGERLEKAGCTLLGGHTIEDPELKFGVAVTGTVPPEALATNSSATPGDALFLTKPLGTGIITTAIKAGMCPEETANQAVGSMTKLNLEARDFMVSHGIKAATDVTGFGLAGHALEICRASGTGMRIYLDSLPVFAGVYDLLEMGMMPAGSFTNRENCLPHVSLSGLNGGTRSDIIFDAQTSGGILMAVPPGKIRQALETRIGVRIGEVTEPGISSEVPIEIL